MKLKIKKFIENIKFKKHIKILLLLFVIVGMFSGYTFADAVSTDADEFIDVIYKAMTFLSRWRVILANLAGKLMTNDIVYGGFLHLDSTLWTFWNVMKNFANFFLWGLVLYAILRNLLSAVWKSGNSKWWPLNVIKNTLIAGVLVQMSRFLVWAVLDVSTVCTAAIWAFPAQFLASSNEFQTSFSKDLGKIVKNKVVIDYSNTNPVRLEALTGNALTWDDVNSLIDTLLPSTESLSGPLIYIWMLVFNFSDYNIQQVADWESWRDLFLAIGINGALLLAYTVMMVLLFIFNLMRLLILWIAIPMMPFIILMTLFDFKIQWSFSEILNIKNLLKLVFKPVILTWALGLILIILVLIKWIINKDATKIEIDDQNLVLTSQVQEDEKYNSEMSISGLLDVNLNWFKDWFADIIVYILWICLIYFVLKLATIKTGIKFIDDAMSGVFERVWKIMTNLPIVPIPWWGNVSIDTLKNHLNSDSVLTKAVWIDEVRQSERIDKMLGVESTLYDSLHPRMSREKFLERAYEISASKWITSIGAMEKNPRYYQELNAKIEAWNKANNNTQSIGISEVFDETNNGKTTTTNTSQVANPEGTSQTSTDNSPAPTDWTS